MATDSADPAGRSRTAGRLVAEELTAGVIGAFFEVRKDLKPGYLESVYKNALEVALADRGLRVEREVPLDVRFRGRIVGSFRADLLVEQRVLVEAKTVERLHPAHLAQVINYLKVSSLCVALLVNFGERFEYKRLVWTGPR